ncbi:MAG: helix-turn-helix transcriptional regulator [Lachnospiraceae bacterium]|mgnify:CR=1 FL=1|nr:helix-turn-helix transcriptional regulator [Lachnospiraceae bacterium]MCI9184040.1 helix-turn-helix transcriptional regulator [Lachnospiraceae bacterium]
MVTYDRLWETMKTKGISQYRLIKYYGFSAGQIGRLKKNAYVSTHTIDVLCTILNCRVEDIMEFRLDTSLNPKLGVDPAVATHPPQISIDKK